MADKDALKEVQLRLERLEDKLSTIAGGTRAAKLSEEEIAAYHRVRTALWEDGSCGINETSPCVLNCRVSTCRVTICDVICRPCDVECTCGPCNLGNLAVGGLSRFRGLGG